KAHPYRPTRLPGGLQEPRARPQEPCARHGGGRPAAGSRTAYLAPLNGSALEPVEQLVQAQDEHPDLNDEGGDPEPTTEGRFFDPAGWHSEDQAEQVRGEPEQRSQDTVSPVERIASPAMYLDRELVEMSDSDLGRVKDAFVGRWPVPEHAFGEATKRRLVNEHRVHQAVHSWRLRDRRRVP